MFNNDQSNIRNLLKNEVFIIVISTKQGQIEYLDFDDQSGGYPYWTSVRKRAHEFKATTNVAESVSSLSPPDRHGRQIFKVKVGLEPVEVLDISNIDQAKSLEEIMILDAQIKAMQAKRNSIYNEL